VGTPISWFWVLPTYVLRHTPYCLCPLASSAVAAWRIEGPGCVLRVPFDVGGTQTKFRGVSQMRYFLLQ